MSCMPALHSWLNGWRLTCIIEQCHVYNALGSNGQEPSEGSLSVTCTRNESFEQGYWASNNSLFRNNLFCRCTPHVTINQILICKGAHADSQICRPSLGHGILCLLLSWATTKFGLTHCRPSLGAGILCSTMVFELRRSLGALTTEPSWELECCVLQWFLSYDEVWAHSLQTLFGSWSTVFYNCFWATTKFGLTHCRLSLGAGILCFTMVFEQRRNLGSLTADPLWELE